MPMAETSETEVSGSPAQPRQSTHLLFPASQLLNIIGRSSGDFCLLFNYLPRVILPFLHFVQNGILHGGAQCCSEDSPRNRELSGSRPLKKSMHELCSKHLVALVGWRAKNHRPVCSRAGSQWAVGCPFLWSFTFRFQFCFPGFVLAGFYAAV